MRLNVQFLIVACAVSVFLQPGSSKGDTKLDELYADRRFDEVLTHGRTIPDSSRTIEIWLKIATAHMLADSPDDSILANVRGAQMITPSDPRIYVFFGRFHANKGDYRKSYNEFKKSWVITRSAQAAAGMASSALAMEQWDKAAEAARNALDLDSTMIVPRETMYKLSARNKDHAETARHLSFLIKRRPNNVEYLKEFARTLELTDQMERLVEIDPRIVSLDSTDVPSRQRLAQRKLADGDTTQAYELYRELAILTPSDPSIFKQLYQTARSVGNDDDALLYLKNYLVLDSTSAVPFRVLGDMQFQRAAYEKAYEAYSRSLALDPDQKGIRKRIAWIAVNHGTNEQALDALVEAIKHGEADHNVRKALGDLYKNKEEYQNALVQYEAAASEAGDSPALLNALAETYLALDSTEGAIGVYERIASLDTTATAVYKTLAELYEKTGRREKALHAYGRAFKKNGGDQKTAKKLGIFAFKQDSCESAVRYLETITDATLQDLKFVTALGVCLHRTGKHEKAVHLLTKAVKKHDSTDLKRELTEYLADSYVALEAPAKAANAYDTFISSTEVKDKDIYFKRARIRETSAPVEAKEFYRENTKFFPDDYRNFHRLGLLYAEKPETRDSSSIYLAKAAALLPDSVAVWRSLAEVEQERGDTAAELAARRKIVDLDSSDAVSHRRIGVLLIEQKDFSGAKSSLDRAIRADSTDFVALTGLARIAIEENNDSVGMAYLVKARSIKENSTELREQLYQLYKKLDMPEEAEKEIWYLIIATKKNEYRFQYVEDLLAAQRFDEAHKILSEISSGEPVNLRKMMLQGRLQRARGSLDEAVETYKTILFAKEGYPPALTERASIHLEKGEIDRAEKLYQRALESDPTYAPAFSGLAAVAKQRGDEDAYTEYKKKAENPATKTAITRE